MVAISDKGAKELAAEVSSLGFVVKKVSQATSDDLAERTQPHDLLKQLKQSIRERERAAKEREERLLADRRRIAAENDRRAAAQRADNAARRESALAKGAGDLLRLEPESALLGNTLAATICAKVELFFRSPPSTRNDILTSINLDFASFQAQFGFPRTNELISILLRELNDCVRISEGITQLRLQIRDDNFLVENQVNSIASRTHIFGGSGDGLLLSLLIASSGARQDQKQIESLRAGKLDRVLRAEQAIGVAENRQQLHEFRAKTVASVVLVGCGKSDVIHINMPPQLEAYLMEGSG